MIRIVYTTVGSEEEAESIAGTVVEERLAACANIVPGVRSIYRWQGKVERDAEVLMLLKCETSRAHALIERIAELHSYDVPDIVALPVEAGDAPYLNWVIENSSG